ncbi:polysaccharide pyruvyl transferase CsaB [Actinopolymorpha alba]|uniref:polysaccharide pyruvyl transferase CsaB n=1 Tax=Actinopolymorpha alba TaxID=533267 RepID=UPI00035C5F2D|nr:polysaccharide pyruvyl transferase CsaB [Actinopolymorpha alba]
MKLALLGYFGFGNAGDEALLAAEVAALRSALGPSAEFVVISGDPDHTMAAHRLPAVPRSDFAEVLRAVRSADGLVAGGGSLLQDVTSARPVAFYGGVMLAARAAGKPVFVYAQGLGPLRRWFNRRLARAALRSASYIAFRDVESMALAAKLGIRELELVPDPVLGVDLSLVQSVQPSARLAVALRPWAGSAEWLPVLRSALAELARDIEIVLVPFHAGQDGQLTRELAASVGLPVVDPAKGHRVVLNAVVGSRAVLGMRLHALITAAAAGRPFVALSYDPKVAAFATQVGQPVAATLPGPVDHDALVAEVRKALEGPDQAYLDRLEVLRAESQRPAREIARLLGV